MKLAHWLLHPGRRNSALAVSFLLVAIIAVADDLTGKSLSLGACYLLPVILASWQGGRPWGLAVSFCSTALVVLVALHVGNPFSKSIYLYAYYGVILLSFILVTEAVAQVREAFDRKTDRQ